MIDVYKYQFVDRVAKVGNAILASSSGVDVPGVTFLLNDMILTEGVVFAFSAYIRSNKPVHFQIWRSVVNGTKDSYRLIGDTRVVPSVNNDREDVSSFLQCDQQGEYELNSTGSMWWNSKRDVC